MKFLIPRIFFILFYFPLRAIFKFFFNFKVEAKEDLKAIKGPMVIVSSHASWVDPFLIGVAFPFFNKAAPVHYATWWKYYYFPVFTLLIWLFGGFPVRKGIGLEKALIAGSKILKKAGAIGIFPTGKRTRKWNESYIPRAKRGAAFLAIKNNAKILPVKIEGNIGVSFKGFLMKKHKITVKVGKAFFLPEQEIKEAEKLNYPSNLIMNKIINL